MRRRGNGEGAVSRRKDGRWEGRYYVDSPEGMKRRSVYGRTRKEVVAKLTKAFAEKDEPRHDPYAVNDVMEDDVTFGDFLEQYEDTAKLTMKRRSFETYEDIVRLHLIPSFGQVKLKNLSRERIQRLYAEKTRDGLSAARVRRIHGVLSSILSHAVRWRVVGHNVCSEVTAPRVPAPEIRPFDSEEAKRFLEAARGERYFSLYVLGVSTGMRVGELGGLFWSDLDLSRSVVRVQRALITGKAGQSFESPKTTNSRRSIGLTKLALAAMRDHRDSQIERGFSVGGDDLVFTNTIGGPINPSHLFCRSFKPLLEKAKLPKTTFHAATRHTFCCLALRQGVNAKSVSLAMGHSSVAFTLQRYASFIPSYGDTANGLDDALGA